MKTYKEYYKQAMDQEDAWLAMESQQKKWWKNKPFSDDLDTKGDYLETVRLLDVDTKNDVSVFKNHTNVKNSEWSCLFGMLGQALVDWCNENVDHENLWSFCISIDRTVSDNRNLYSCSYKVRNIKDHETVIVSDKRFEECKNFLCDLFDEFLMHHGNDIPLDWNYFCFSLDSLDSSCEWGGWISDSDGYMTFGHLVEGDKKNYDEYFLSM